MTVLVYLFKNSWYGAIINDATILLVRIKGNEISDMTLNQKAIDIGISEFLGIGNAGTFPFYSTIHTRYLKKLENMVYKCPRKLHVYRNQFEPADRALIWKTFSDDFTGKI